MGRIDDLREELDRYFAAHELSGMLRVTQRDRVLLRYQHGYADRETGEPFTEASRFKWYSVSKQLCAIGVMKLAEQGLFDFTAHPGKYVPEARGFHPGVNFARLLHHTSGIPDPYQTPEFRSSHTPSLERLRKDVRELTAYPQEFAPGTQEHYINAGFILAALALENITGEDYGDFMEREVLAPLGMKNACIDRDGRAVPDRVQGYSRDGEDGPVYPVQPPMAWMRGAGDVLGTVSDLYCLNRELKAPRLLRPESWQLILTPEPLNHKGLGCTLTSWHGRRRVTHNGGHLGFRSLHIQLPEEDFDLIFLSNAGYHNSGRADVAEMVYRCFFEEDAAAEEGPDLDKGYV